ncbi:hypothetical protein T484DRAFT_1886257, partial [Baffinella frigidus]
QEEHRDVGAARVPVLARRPPLGLQHSRHVRLGAGERQRRQADGALLGHPQPPPRERPEGLQPRLHLRRQGVPGRGGAYLRLRPSQRRGKPLSQTLNPKP